MRSDVSKGNTFGKQLLALRQSELESGGTNISAFRKRLLALCKTEFARHFCGDTDNMTRTQSVGNVATAARPKVKQQLEITLEKSKCREQALIA